MVQSRSVWKSMFPMTWENYTLASVSYSQLPADTSDMCYETLSCVVNVSARYVRFKAFRRNLPLHAWLFTDEIVVN